MSTALPRHRPKLRDHVVVSEGASSATFADVPANRAEQDVPGTQPAAAHASAAPHLETPRAAVKEGETINLRFRRRHTPRRHEEVDVIVKLLNAVAPDELEASGGIEQGVIYAWGSYCTLSKTKDP